MDLADSAAAAIRHVIGLGHRRLALLTAPLPFGCPWARAISSAARGLHVHIDTRQMGDGDVSSFECAYIAARELLAHGARYTTLFTWDDAAAMGVLRALRESDFAVPGDVSVVGFGDHIGAAAYTPRLTTVRIPSQEAGERAAQMIVRRIEDGSTGARSRAAPIDAVFDARETTGIAREPQGRTPRRGKVAGFFASRCTAPPWRSIRLDDSQPDPELAPALGREASSSSGCRKLARGRAVAGLALASEPVAELLARTLSSQRLRHAYRPRRANGAHSDSRRHACRRDPRSSRRAQPAPFLDDAGARATHAVTVRWVAHRLIEIGAWRTLQNARVSARSMWRSAAATVTCSTCQRGSECERASSTEGWGAREGGRRQRAEVFVLLSGVVSYRAPLFAAATLISVNLDVFSWEQTSFFVPARLLHKIGSPSGIPAFGSTTERRRAPQDSSVNAGENMDTNTLLIIVVAVLLLGGGGFFFRRRA